MEKKSLHITNLEVNTDLPGCELLDNVFSKAINFRPVDGKLVGTKVAMEAPFKADYEAWILYLWATVPIEPLNIVAGQRGDQFYFLVSGKAGDFVFDGSSWVQITSAERVLNSVGSDVNLWTTTKLGFNLIVNHSEFFPEYWSGQFGDALKPVAFSPTKTFQQQGIRCKAIRSHKNFLFALGLNERGVDFPYSYRWSHPADINGMPFSWDEQDLSTMASKESVGGDYGVIVDGLSLRDSFCLYTESSIHVLDYTGDEHVFRRRLLTSSHGCLATNCVAEALNVHYVMTKKDIVVNDGTSVSSLLTSRLKKVYANLSQRFFEASFAIVNHATNEVWFCFPEGNYEFPSAAIIYNYVTKQLGFTRLTNALSVDTNVVSIPPDIVGWFEGTEVLTTGQRGIWVETKFPQRFKIGDGTTPWTSLTYDVRRIPIVYGEDVIDTAAWWASNGATVLTNGQRSIESDTGEWKQGNGADTWAALSYEAINFPTVSSGSSLDVSIGRMSSICFGAQLPAAFPWRDLVGHFDSWGNWQLPIVSEQLFVGSGVDTEVPVVAATSTDTWSPSNSAALLSGLYGVGPSISRILQIDGSNIVSSQAMPLVVLFEKTNWALDGQIEVKTLTRVYPSCSAVGSLGEAKLYVGAHDYNGSPIRWNEPVTFDPISDRKIDVRVTGELLAIRFEFRGYDEVEFYGYDVDYTLNGKR